MDDYTDFLTQAEIDLEELAAAQGAARTLERIEEEGSSSGACLKVLRGALPVAMNGIAEALEGTKRREDRQTAAEIITHVPPSSVAMVGLTRMLEVATTSRDRTVQALVRRIAGDVETELWVYTLANHDPQFFRWLCDRQTRKSTLQL